MKKTVSLASMLILSFASLAQAEAPAVVHEKADCTFTAINAAGPLIGETQTKDFSFNFSTDGSSPSEVAGGQFAGYTYMINVNTKNAAAGALTFEIIVASKAGDTAKGSTSIEGFYDGSSKVTSASAEMQHHGKTAALQCIISQE